MGEGISYVSQCINVSYRSERVLCPAAGCNHICIIYKQTCGQERLYVRDGISEVFEYFLKI